MDRINHVNDQKRFFFFIAPFFTLSTGGLLAILTKVDFSNDISSFFIFSTMVKAYFVPFVFQMFFYWAVLMDSYDKATVNYFKDLLIQARDEKNNKTESD